MAIQNPHTVTTINGYPLIAAVMIGTARCREGEKLPFVGLVHRAGLEYPFVTFRWDGVSESWHAGEYDLDAGEAAKSMTQRSGQDCGWVANFTEEVLATFRSGGASHRVDYCKEEECSEPITLTMANCPDYRGRCDACQSYVTEAKQWDSWSANNENI